jgi:hypothetical protein
MYKFLVYKIYHFAKMQEESASVRVVFLAYISLFELFHLIIAGFTLETLGYDYSGNSEFVDKYFKLLFIVIGFSLNYFIFLKSKLIYKIFDYYQAQNRSNWKDNLLFLGYLFIMIFVILLQAYLSPRFVR